MWMGIVADCVTSAIFLTAMAPNLLLIGLMKSASHATMSWGDWFLGMLPLSILLVLLVPWLAYVLYPPVLKSGGSGAALGRDGTAGNGPALFA